MPTLGVLPAESAQDLSPSAIPASSAPTGPIVFFDGVCGLCNESVDRLVKWDRHAVFKLAPLQGETARQWLSPSDTQQLGSVVLIADGRTFRKSAAVVRILCRLGTFGRIAGVLLWLIPRPIRDLGYVIVARNRYRWFGKKETCRLPTAEERTRFLP